MSQVIARMDGVVKVLTALKDLTKLRVECGILAEDARRPTPDGRLTYGELTYIQIHGTRDGHIPKRDFFNRTTRRGRAEILREYATAGKNVANGATPRKELERLGQHVAGMLRNTIEEMVPPPNADETIARKGFDHPLIHTRGLIELISSRVRDGARPTEDAADEGADAGVGSTGDGGEAIGETSIALAEPAAPEGSDIGGEPEDK